MHEETRVPYIPYVYINPWIENNLMQWRMLNFNNSQQIQQTKFVFFIGTLAAPANLKAVYINTTIIHLRWNAPFSLQNISGTNKPDILGYHLQITNQNTGDVTRVNTTTTEYILLVDGDCITYEARVCAINVVGEGDLGESVTMTSLGGKEHSVKLYHLHDIKISNYRKYF